MVGISFGPEPRAPGALALQRGMAGFVWMGFVGEGDAVVDGEAEGCAVTAGGCDGIAEGWGVIADGVVGEG